MGCMGFIRASFESTKSKIGQEMAEFHQITKGKLRDSSKYHAKCKRASFEPKRSKIGQETAE